MILISRLHTSGMDLPVSHSSAGEESTLPNSDRPAELERRLASLHNEASAGRSHSVLGGCSGRDIEKAPTGVAGLDTKTQLQPGLHPPASSLNHLR